MTIDINNYIPIDLNIVKTNLNIIKMHTNGVLCTNNDNVSLLIPNHKLDILFDRNCINKDIFTNFYIEKSSKEVWEKTSLKRFEYDSSRRCDLWFYRRKWKR